MKRQQKAEKVEVTLRLGEKARGQSLVDARAQEPTSKPWGGIEAIFSDPDGNTFSLNSL